MTRTQIKLIGLSSLSGTLEFFDFVIYALFASYLSQAFFPSTDAIASLLNTYGVFAIGYLGRPIGALLFGHVGDLHGRKYAFTFAAFLMACSTFLIGCLPTYQQIGLPATVLLILLRVAQGISLGGEIGGATVFVTEHVATAKRGLAVGLVFMAISFGNVFGSLLGYALTHFMSEKTLFAWGWRIPFWVGFVLGIVAYFIRKRTIETPEFMAMLSQQKSLLPIATLLRTAFPQMLIGISLTAISAGTFAILMYLPSYMTLILHYPVSGSYLNNLAGFLLVSLLSGFFGFLSDYIGRKQLLIIGSCLLLISSYYLFHAFILSQHLLAFNLALGFIAAIANGCYGCAIAEQFRTEIRYTGMAFSFNLGITLFAGLAPLCSLLVFNLTHNLYAPVYFLAACGGITLIGASFMRSSLASVVKLETVVNAE